MFVVHAMAIKHWTSHKNEFDNISRKKLQLFERLERGKNITMRKMSNAEMMCRKSISEFVHIFCVYDDDMIHSFSHPTKIKQYVNFVMFILISIWC